MSDEANMLELANAWLVENDPDPPIVRGFMDREKMLVAFAEHVTRALGDERDALREALDDCNRMAAAMYVNISLASCWCSPSVQPPHNFKCYRCKALEEFDRRRIKSEEKKP